MGRFSIGKLSLVLLVFICLITGITGCQYFETQTNGTNNTEKSVVTKYVENEAIFIESILAHSQPLMNGGWRYWIEVKLIPLDKAKSDFWYTVELQKMGHTVNTRGVKWLPPELSSRQTKTMEFPIQESDLPTYPTKTTDIFSIKIREETHETTIQYWESQLGR
jgi:hypothetical protein